MRRRILFLILALAALAVAEMGLFLPAPAQAVKCWTQCCAGTTRCITCCAGQICPDLACP